LRTNRNHEAGGRRGCACERERTPDRHGHRPRQSDPCHRREGSRRASRRLSSRRRHEDRQGRTGNLRVGGFMESYPFSSTPEEPSEQREPLSVDPVQEQVEEEAVEKVRAARPRRRTTRRKTAAAGSTSRKRTGGRRKKATARKKSTGTRR